MGAISLRPLDRSNERDVAQWRTVWEKAPGATIFHHPDFLAYHGDRFDERHLGCFNGEQLFGLIPMALVEQEARSPYGGSFGGFIFAFPLDFSKSDQVAAAFLEELGRLGACRATVTPPLPAHSREPQDSFLFALLHRGFRIANSDVTSIVPLGPQVESEVFTSRARNMARKAEKAGVTCVQRAPFGDFWPLMEMTFDRLGATPTHTAAQWQWLMERLPDSVWVDVAYLGGKPVAGIGHLKVNGRVDSSFYLCSDPDHQETQALTLLIARTIAASAGAGFRWFDFGTSSANMVPRENLFRFKESFGALGMFRHTLKAELR